MARRKPRDGARGKGTRAVRGAGAAQQTVRNAPGRANGRGKGKDSGAHANGLPARTGGPGHALAQPDAGANGGELTRARNGRGAPGGTCGDFGGRTDDGKPCTREPGWGSAHPGEGACKDHDAAAAVKLQDIKKKFLAAYALQPKTGAKAADEAGVNYVTIWRMRQEDEEFDRDVQRLKDVVWECRDDMVEDALFARCQSAKGSPLETVFYLQNRRGDKWIDRRRQEHTGARGGPIVQEHRARQVVTFAGQEIEV